MNQYPHFPKNKFRVRVTQYYNPQDFFDTKALYVTAISVFSAHVKSHMDVPFFTVYSKCNPSDVPIRKVGFQIAYERAVMAAIALDLIEIDEKELSSLDYALGVDC